MNPFESLDKKKVYLELFVQIIYLFLIIFLFFFKLFYLFFLSILEDLKLLFKLSRPKMYSDMLSDFLLQFLKISLIVLTISACDDVTVIILLSPLDCFLL